MRVLIAFDKFKDALTAPAAVEIAREVIAEVQPDWSVETCPLADGGEGFASILTAAAGGTWHEVEVRGPRGAPAASGFGLVDTTTLPASARSRLAIPGVRKLAVIEMATASGLESLAPADRDPWQTDSLGTGQAIAAAAAAGAEAVLLGVGGSATNDLGVGALTALGWTPLNAAGEPIRQLAPAGWRDLVGFAPTDRTLPPIRIACDVANPLLGPRGATAVFGPQKGLRSEDLVRLEGEITRVAGLLAHATGRPGLESTPGAGAAGGIAFGLLTATDARLVPGFDLVEDWLGIEAKLADADLVITGEGCFDQSSLEGKGPGSLLKRAETAGKAGWIFAGAVRLDPRPAHLRITAITPEGVSLSDALRTTPQNLARCLRQALLEASYPSVRD